MAHIMQEEDKQTWVTDMFIRQTLDEINDKTESGTISRQIVLGNPLGTWSVSGRNPNIRAWKRGVWDSGFKFQTGMGFRIQISNRAGFRIQISVRQYVVLSKFVWDSNFRALLWDSYFKVAGIQDSNFKWVGFRIQNFNYVFRGPKYGSV